MSFDRLLCGALLGAGLSFVLLATAPVQAQTKSAPSALNVVNLCPYDAGGTYSNIHDVWGLRLGGKDYALAALSKNVASLGGVTPGVAVIDATNPASPQEKVFISTFHGPDTEAKEPDAADVETYTAGGVAYLYVARKEGGVQAINLSAVMGDSGVVGMNGTRRISRATHPQHYGLNIARLNTATNPLPSTVPSRNSQTHTLTIAGDYLYIATQSSYVDIWSLRSNPMQPQKVGLVFLSVPIGADPVQGQTILADTSTSETRGGAVYQLRPRYYGVHEMYASRTANDEARLYVALTRGGLHVFDLDSLGTLAGDPFERFLTPHNLKVQLYDNDRATPLAIDADDDNYDYRGTHSAWPIVGGQYVITADEHDIQSNPNYDNVLDYYPLNRAYFDGSAWQVSDPSDIRLTGEAAYKRGGNFLRFWKYDDLGSTTTNALKAVYDVPESQASVGVTSAITPSAVPNSVHQMFARGDLVYVASYSQGVRVLKVSNMGVPEEVGFYDPVPEMNLGNYRGKYFDGFYGVFPDEYRPGIFYATSSNHSDGGSTFEAVNFMRYFTGAVDVATIPHSVTLRGTFNVPQSVAIAAGATVTVDTDAALTMAPSTALTVQAGATLNVRSGAVFNMSPNTYVNVYGRIDATGTTAKPVRFRQAVAGQRWKEMVLLGNGNRFAYVVFDGGNKNVEVASRDNVFRFSRFKNGYRGLSSTWTSTYGRSQYRLEDSIVEGNTTVGALGYNADVEIVRSTLQNNGESGATMLNADLTTLTASRITGNASVGLHLYGNSDAIFPPYALNRIVNNPGHSVLLEDTGYLYTQASNSSIYNDGGPPSGKYYVYNGVGTVVNATDVWWGTSPQSFFFYRPSNMTYLPGLSYPYGTSGGAPGGVPSQANLGSEPLALGADGVESEDAASLRALVREHPDAPETPARLWRLYGLARSEGGATAQDATAKTSERAEASAVFTELGGRLLASRADLSASGLRGAETAALLSVREAVRTERFAEAEAMVATYSAAVEGEDARRSLAVTAAVLLDRRGDQAGALARLAALGDDKSEGGGLRLLREVIGERRALVESKGGAADVPSPSLSVSAVPASFEASAYPNPFRTSSIIRFALPEASAVRVEVYDMLGRRVGRLVDEARAAGTHEATFEAAGLAAGLYVYRVTAGRHVKAGTVVLAR